MPSRGVSVGFMPAAGSSSSSSLGLGGQRAGDFQPALVAVGQVAGPSRCALSASADELQQSPAPCRGRRSSRRKGGQPQQGATPEAFSRVCMPVMTFSSTVMSENMRMFWNVRASQAGFAGTAGRDVTSRPSSVSVPDVGGSRPEIRLNSVVLPAPFGPMMP